MERSKSHVMTTTSAATLSSSNNGNNSNNGNAAGGNGNGNGNAPGEKKKDDPYFAQRQSAMDSETLDKLLMVEKNLFQADQATRSAWHLINKQDNGRGTTTGGNGSEYGGEENDHMNIPPPPPPPPSSTASTMNSTNTGSSSNVVSSATTFSSSMMSLSSSGISPFSSSTVGNNGHVTNAIPMARLVEANGAGGSTASSMPNVLSTSPKYPIEIPRVEGRSSLGSYPSASSNIYEKPLNFGLKPASSVDTFNESSIAAEHHVRSRSSHNIFGFNRDTPPRSEVTLFTFTVKKSDSVLEKLGSKKASIQLQVDIETRMLNFLSPHDNRESYSCAAVTARPHSRLGMQLKIQTGNASLNKKITFYSMEDRANFLNALEEAKVIYKPTQPPRPPMEVTLEESLVNSVDSVARTRLRDSMVTDNFTLLPGENVLEHVQRVTNLVVMSQSDRAVQGVLKITTYRITFTPYDASWKFGSFEVPLATIDLITRDGLMLLIACKDLRTLRLAMHDAYTRKKGYDQLPTTPDFRWLNLLTLRMKPPNSIGALFAFDYHTEKIRQKGPPHPKNNGWFLYSPNTEYTRLGFLRSSGDRAKKEQDESTGTSWRILKNYKFRFSPTYPQTMIVPSIMSEDQLVQSARFRSRARLPVAVWRHPVNHSVLARSSQPNYGMAGNKSEPDRILLRAYRDSANKNSNNISPPLHIIDARKPIATKGNRLKGKGVENSQHYDNATIEFMGIANIHKMRESVDALKTLISPSSVEDGDKNYHHRLENTRWLKHIMRVLSGARRVAEVLHEDGASVLVHCSDGWDRTPQLVALAQLILDPYYRTIRGFACLVEKEWCSFGHKFADRIGIGKDITEHPNERSPVMLQFLDCVWQMTRQFPTCFEFNEKFLLHISDALLSGLYGTFLYNSERERLLDKVWERTESVWTPVLGNPTPYKNPLYRSTNRVLYPRANLKRVVLWDAMFFRWDPESHPDYMEYMEPVGDDDGGAGSNGTNPNGAANSPSLGPMLATDLDDEEKAFRLDIDVIHDYHDDFRHRLALSDCSDMSDDEDNFATSPSLSAVYTASTISMNETPHSTMTDFAPLTGHCELDDEFLERYRRGAEERTRQRAQGRNIREALQEAPDQSRIKYLEQLLSESVARELQLEAELDSMHHRMTMNRTTRHDSQAGV